MTPPETYALTVTRSHCGGTGKYAVKPLINTHTQWLKYIVKMLFGQASEDVLLFKLTRPMEKAMCEIQ